MFSRTFLRQIFSQLCFSLEDFIKSVRLYLAAVSINGLNPFLPLMPSSEEPDVVTLRRALDDLGRPIGETFLLGVNQFMGWKLQGESENKS